MLSSDWVLSPRDSQQEAHLEKGAPYLAGGQFAATSLTLTNPGADQ